MPVHLNYGQDKDLTPYDTAGLNTAEGFDLESNSLSPPLDLGSSSSSRLGQALQMRFQRKGNSSKLGEYPNAIMIDPLAPMSAVR